MTSNQQVHELKCARKFFDAVESGEKHFEIRVDDRPFKIGDTLYLREVDLLLHYTGRATRKRVTFILRGWGIKHGYVGLGLTSMRPVETTSLPKGVRSALDQIKHGAPPAMDNAEVAAWAAGLAANALACGPDEELSDIPTYPIAGDAEARFMLWLMKEMPAGTVIGTPSWWSPRIFKAVLRAIEVQEQVRPSPEEPTETYHGIGCAARRGGNCNCAAEVKPEKAAASHTTEQDFQHWLSYSGADSTSDADLRAAYYAGANAEPPESGTPHGEAGDRAGPRVGKSGDQR